MSFSKKKRPLESAENCAKWRTKESEIFPDDPGPVRLPKKEERGVFKIVVAHSKCGVCCECEEQLEWSQSQKMSGLQDGVGIDRGTQRGTLKV